MRETAAGLPPGLAARADQRVPRAVLLVAEGFGGAQMGGAVGWDGSEDEAHDAGDSHGNRNGRGRNGNADAGEQAHGRRNRDAGQGAGDAAGEAHQDGLGEELGEDRPAGGPEGQADTDLVGALCDGGQHDIHDADAGDSQGDAGHQQQCQGKDQRDVARRLDEGSQGLHLVAGAGAVTGLEDLLYAPRHAVHLFGGTRAHVERIDALGGCEVALHGDRDDEGIALDLGLPVGLHLLAEGANHGELQVVQVNDLVERGGAAAEHILRQVIGQERHLLALRDIVLIEEPAGADDEVAHGGVGGVGAVDLDVLVPVVDANAVDIRHYAGGRQDVGAEFLADGLDVGEFDGIGVGSRAGRGDPRVIGKDQIGADTLDFLQNVVAADQGDGDHQDDRGGANRHGEGGEQAPYGVGAQGGDAELKGFLEEHAAV